MRVIIVMRGVKKGARSQADTPLAQAKLDCSDRVASTVSLGSGSSGTGEPLAVSG
jgi:hypothetical protein